MADQTVGALGIVSRGYSRAIRIRIKECYAKRLGEVDREKARRQEPARDILVFRRCG